MSNAPWSHDDRSPGGLASADLRARVREHALAPLEFLGFWSAIALPFLYVPLLLGGLDGTEGLAFALLVAVNVAALALGQNYKR